MPSICWPAYSCPQHHTPLAAIGDALICDQGERFSIRDGIPRFVPHSDYSAAFGAQWKRYRRTQLDSYSGTTITRDRLRRCLGEPLWNELQDKQVLECGCGAGRFTEVLLSRGAVVTSIDLSEAVEANGENCPASDYHRIAQADIMNLPFAPGQYDVVLCLGVIQHTPNPEQTIARLSDQVKPGGFLVIDHYRRSLSRFATLSVLYRELFRRLPPEQGIQYTEKLVRTLLPVHRALRSSFVLQKLLGRVSPVACYYRAYPELSDDLQFEWALLDTHDGLTDWYKHLRTREQIRETLSRLGLRDLWCTHGGNGVEARGRRG